MTPLPRVVCTRTCALSAASEDRHLPFADRLSIGRLRLLSGVGDLALGPVVALCQVAAVDAQVLAGDEAGSRGAEEEDRGRDLDRLADAPEDVVRAEEGLPPGA